MNELAWKDWDPKDCKPHSIPSKDILFNPRMLQQKDDWVESKHKWCKGCYSAYLKVCKTVSDEFNIPYDSVNQHWKEDDLKNMVNKIYRETKDDHFSKWLMENEPKMKAIITCVITRYFHHQHCYKPVSPRKIRVSETTTEGHMRNINVLCASLLKLYILYEKKLKQFNDNTLGSKKKNLLLDLNSECADNCRNALKSGEFKNIIDELNLKSSDINKLETNTKRSKRSREKRSRRKKHYKVDRNKISNILNTTLQ